MFNYDLLGEVQFWRDFLSDSRPRKCQLGDKQNLPTRKTSRAEGRAWPDW